VTFDLDRFRELLESHAGTPIAHLHFTGGEASLHRHLPDMIRMARDHGVERSSLTTNGTAPIDRYAAAARAGLDELRISIDAADADLGRRMTLVDGAWERSLETLVRLVALRASGEIPRLFLIANTVVSLANARDVPRIVRLLLAAGADDLKLITEVGSRDVLPSMEHREAIRAEVKAVLAEHPPSSYPLLRRKLETVFSPASIGLDRIVGRSDFRCYIPLSERTVDGVYYYPCSVVLREGGAPLGLIDEPQEVQRARTAAFVRRGDCLTDPICRRYCLHCTREYNVAANARR
jgi:MoaA/NifB/PqqE/SkfB family radical SAM enzyme